MLSFAGAKQGNVSALDDLELEESDLVAEVVMDDSASSLDGEHDTIDEDTVSLVPAEGSAKSTTLHVMLESVQDSPHLPPRPVAHIAHSLPVHAMHIKMGSSVPIAIPSFGHAAAKPAMQPAARPFAAAPEPTDAQSGFVPPHQYSQVDSWLGASPGTQLKRERLRARNAILQRTGFLEPGAAGAKAFTPAQGPRPIPISASRATPGGLSQALQGSPASSR